MFPQYGASSHYLQELFGDDPDVFRPERWLGVSPAQRDRMTSVVDLSFGHGRYICSGKPLAVMELNKVYVEVRIQYFELGPIIPVVWGLRPMLGFVADMWLFLTALARIRLPADQRDKTVGRRVLHQPLHQQSVDASHG